MTYWESSIFKRIYKKWQKRISRHSDHYFQTPIEYAKKEFFALEDSLEMKGKPLSLQPTKPSEDTFITEEPKPPIEEDETISVLGMKMKNSKYRELMELQRNVSTAKTLTPDQKMFLYLKSLFRGDHESI